MTSLGFDLLDRHVVAGRADHLAAGGLTYARLLERSAALAAGLKVLGVAAGDRVVVGVEGDERVLVVCACIRLGAVPVDAGTDEAEEGLVAVVQTAEGGQVRAGEEIHALDLVRRAGSGDPAPALGTDAPGYRDAVLGGFGPLVDPLLEGRSA